MISEVPRFPDRYRGPELVRRGATTALYRAEDTILCRPVALKVMAGAVSDPALLTARLEKEAATLARLDHPGIVRVYDVLPEPGPTLVEEYVPGRGLAELIEGAPLDPGRVARLLAALLDALAHAHDRGVVHRSLEPGGVVVTPEDAPRILDFGYAAWTEACAATLGGPVLARFDYAAPEVIRGEEATPAADLYSLAVIAAELLTGSLPHPRGKPHRRVVPGELPGVPDALATVILAWLSPDPASRPDAAAASSVLQRLARGGAGDTLVAEADWMALARQVLHPLKNRLALARRYPNDPDRVVALMARPAVRAETRDGVEAALEQVPGGLAALPDAPGAELPALRALAEALATADAPVGPSLLEPAFCEVKALVDRAVGGAERHLVSLREWAAAWAEASPFPVRVGIEGASSMTVLAADAARVRHDLGEVAATLVANAAEAGASSLVLRVAADEEHCTLTFEDDGPGLPPGDPEALFAAGASAGKSQGSGLGLSDARSRLVAHRGTLRAEPGEGGARFVASLPRRPGEGDTS